MLLNSLRLLLSYHSVQLQTYMSEGVPYSTIVFEDNSTVLELFEHKQMGIFSQLNEACMYPRPNDAGLVTKLNALHAKYTLSDLFWVLPLVT